MSTTVFATATNGSFSAEYLLAFRHIQTEALRFEAGLFFANTPDLNRPAFERTLAGDQVQQLMLKAERKLLEDFETRLSRWAERVQQSGEESTLLRDGEIRCAVNLRAFRLARRMARRALPVAWLEVQASQRALQEWVEENRKAALDFARKHSSSVTPPVSDGELADLQRRLFDLWLTPLTLSDEARAKAAKTNPLLSAAIRAIEKLNDALCHQETRGDGRLVITGLPASDSQIKERNVLTSALLFAYHWPRVLEKWRLERRPTSLARFPTALVIGKGSVAPFFGHTINGKLHGVTRGGRVERIIVSRHGAVQLGFELNSTRVLPLNPTSDDLINGIGDVAGNRAFRFFGAVLMAAHDDLTTGAAAVEGGFYYRPGRFAEMLGLSSDKDSVKALDACLQALMEISITATMKVGGQSVKITAKSLIINGQGTIEPLSKRGPGRPQASLYRVQDDVLGLMRDGGAWLPLTRDVLAPPQGVDQRVWDDAFKVYLALGSYARHTRRRGAYWRNKVETVLDASNITKRGARPAQRLNRLELLCGHLSSAGLLNFSIENGFVSFDVPKLGPALENVRARKQLKSPGSDAPGKG